MTTEVTPRFIRCKECGKVWNGISAYKADQGCDRPHCQNTEEAIRVSRRRGRGVGVGHIKPDKLIDVPDNDAPVRQVRLQVHKTTCPVTSTWDHEEPLVTMEVSDVININIFPRKG